MSSKRKNDSDLPARKRKRVRLSMVQASTANDESDGESPAEKEQQPAAAETAKSPPESKRKRVVKLAPPRPFPTVPRSVAATGPRSAHKEGKNLICITRKTSLGAYMRRCKDVIMKDGATSLHLSAMGAAIPLLLNLSLALPPILPFDPKEIDIKYTTDTVQVHDEVIPDAEEKDITYQMRGKSTVMVVFTVPDSMGKPGPSKETHAQSKGGISPTHDDELMEVV